MQLQVENCNYIDAITSGKYIKLLSPIVQVVMLMLQKDFLITKAMLGSLSTYLLQFNSIIIIGLSLLPMLC